MGWVETIYSGITFYQCQELNDQQVVQAISDRNFGNLALHTGDDPEAVVARRELWLKALGLGLEGLVCGVQVHGTRVAVAHETAAGSGAYSLCGAIPETDALITNRSGIVLATFTADCLPIFIYDPVKPAIGIIHAGWRGTIDRIAAATMERMVKTFGTVPGDCRAAIGPSICAGCFRVDERLAERFAKVHSQTVIKDQSGFSIDLQAFNRIELTEIGVCSNHIYEAQFCTKCQAERFFSYRADHGKTGRMMGVIALK